ncbi:MAG: Tetratricopeptide repeat protein [Candidatus Thermoplasmatota archaeon]|nr:Tetratricopeptide repeat protein [Candidatus Thermoplasmatota archaeon]
MVQLDKILSERSDERTLRALMALPDMEFGSVVEKVLGCLELRTLRSRPRGDYIIADCEHRPDGRKYTVFFSRKDAPVAKNDVLSLISYTEKTGSDNALVFSASGIASEGERLLRERSIGYADGPKLASLLRRFDLDRLVVGYADSKKAEVVPEPARMKVAGSKLEDAMRAGYDALAAKDHMRALEAFDLAIYIDDTYDVSWRLKGNTLDEMGYNEQALECYKRALELLPESDETWFSLGNCFYSLGRFTEEIMCYDKALFYNPALQKALINRGSTLHRLGRYQDALETYDRVLKINYRLEKVHNNKGATLHAMGHGLEALDSYNRAIELRHDYVEAWMNKGNLLYELARYDEALAAFTQVTGFRPEYPKGWYTRGLVLRKLEKPTQAKAAFEQALRLDPDFTEARKALDEESKKVSAGVADVPRLVEDIFRKPSSEQPKPTEERVPEPPAPVMEEDVVTRVQEQKVEALAEELYGDRAELLFLLGRLDEAFDFLGKSLRLEGENAPLLTAAGNVLYRQGRLEAAVKSYEHAVAADPTYVPALVNLQTALMDSKEWEPAHSVSDALRRSGAGWQGHVLASYSARQKNDYPKAVEDVENAIAAEGLSALLNYRGLIKLDAEDMDGAADSFARAKTSPLDPSEAHNNAGVMLYRKGDVEAASIEFDKSIRLLKANAPAWNNRGCVLYKMDRIREAVACFEESLIISPSPVAAINKGFSQLTLDSLPEALASFEHSLKLGETPEAHNDRGIVLLRMGKIEDAHASFAEALRLSPEFKDAAANLRRAESLRPPPAAAEPGSGPKAPPKMEVVGGKEPSTVNLAQLTLQNLRDKRKSELEAICETLGVSSRGTKSELINRIVRMKKQQLPGK